MNADNPANAPSDRAKRILRVLIENYIQEGHPVGSRTLSKASGLELSPATIRNVMADLEDLGFVVAPHTSAGRVPTAKGYRFFVDTLLKLRPPAMREVSRLQHQLQDEVSGNARAIAETASSALSALTSLAGVVTLPRQSRITLRQVEFLPLSDRRVLAILVINDSEVENRIIDMDRDYSSDELRQAANYLNQNFGGQDLQSIRTRVLDELRNTRESMNQLMIDVINIAQLTFDAEPGAAKYVISGETKLMEFDELSNIDTLKHLVRGFQPAAADPASSRSQYCGSGRTDLYRRGIGLPDSGRMQHCCCALPSG